MSTRDPLGPNGRKYIARVKPLVKEIKDNQPRRGEEEDADIIMAGTFTFLGIHFVFSTKTERLS